MEKFKKIDDIYESSKEFFLFMTYIMHLVKEKDLIDTPYNDLHKLFGCFSDFKENVDYITEVLIFQIIQ